MAAGKILIVEDEMVIAMEIEALLEEKGYVVAGMASNGRDAIDKAAELCPDLILMDVLLMGSLTGIDAAHAILATRAIPIIFLTSYADRDIIDKIKTIAPAAYLLKPVRSETLYITIEITLYRFDMESRLRDSEERFRALADSAHDAIVVVGPGEGINYWNNAAERIFGYSRSEALGRLLADLIDPQSRNVSPNGGISEHISAGGEHPEITLPFLCSTRRKDGTIVPVSLTVSKITLQGKRHAIGIIRDISERMEMERRITEIEEEERAWIARDLHDGLGQQLTGIRYLGGILQIRLEKEGSPHAAVAAELNSLIGEAKKMISALAQGFGAIELEKEGGLIQAINHMLQGIQKIFAITIRFHHTDDMISKPLALHLYFIIREIITNEIRHGGVRMVEVTLGKEGSNVTVEIRDDGAVPGPVLNQDGMGLKIMRHRLTRIRGVLEVRGLVPRGTLYSIIVEDRPQEETA